MRPSVILIRTTGEADCGCCRIPQSALPFQNQDPAFAEQRATMDRMGVVYRALRERFGQAIDLQIVDPRNIALPILLVRDSWTNQVGLGEAMRTLAGIPMQGVIVNGRIVDESAAPDAREIVDLVSRLTAVEQLTAV
jgi:hypothetical protein